MWRVVYIFFVNKLSEIIKIKVFVFGCMRNFFYFFINLFDVWGCGLFYGGCFFFGVGVKYNGR